MIFVVCIVDEEDRRPITGEKGNIPAFYEWENAQRYIDTGRWLPGVVLEVCGYERIQEGEKE